MDKINRKKTISKVFKRKPRKIEGVFKKSISKITVKNILTTNASELNKEYRRLFKGIIKDEGLVNIMIEQSNIEKIKWRFEIKADVYALNGQKIIGISKGSGGDLQELKSLLSGKIWRGQNIENDYESDIKIALEQKGYIVEFLNAKGESVDRVDVRIIMRG